jgi:glycine oxidase
MTADVTVVGAGLIALATAAELAERGIPTRLIGTTHQGEASSAAAGMLAPSTEQEVRIIHRFATASRDLYPGYLAALEAKTGISVPLNRLGILQIAFTPEGAKALQGRSNSEGVLLDAAQVIALEPTLIHAAGGVLYPDDGCLDPLLLLEGLRLLVSRHKMITIHSENVRHINLTAERCQVTTDQENRYHSHRVVLAAGAWTPQIKGLPRPIPIQPVRGQMVAFGGAILRHVVYGPHGYIVPKADGHTLAGSTMERAGFSAQTTDDGIAVVRAIGEEICPTLRTSRISASWAGLRPVTPDLLPILGSDPEVPNVIYACGHSRNGVLLTPLTAKVVADVVTGAVPQYDLAQFRPDRF